MVQPCPAWGVLHPDQGDRPLRPAIVRPPGRLHSALAVLVLALVAGCQAEIRPTLRPSLAATGTPRASAPPSATASPRVPDTLPAGFPIPHGAIEAPRPQDDEAVLARWRSDASGATLYRFYRRELPAAGYPIVGSYPGGSVAVIRFRAPAGAIWQVVLTGDASVTRIEVRLDQP
jgi:hypothetical protein